MVTESQAVEYILDCDGSCRDVTFTPTTRAAVLAFLRSMVSRYSVKSACDNNGVDRSGQLLTDDSLKDITGYVHIVLTDGDGLIPHLQIFVDRDPETGEHCVEVTFFPDDIKQDFFSLSSFRALVDDWNRLLVSDDYFVRYENASWKLYDPMDVGVIYSRKLPPVA